MKTLSKNWMTEGLIDFEYKKYQLLAYLKEANREFKNIKLYPMLSDLIDHHRVADEIKSGKLELSKLFPKQLDSIDFKQFSLNYSNKIKEDSLMEELSKINDFALSRFASQIEDGMAIYDFVEEQIEFDPVGILPIYNREGFILLSQEYSSHIYAFRYKSDLQQYAGEKFRSIAIWMIRHFTKSITNTFERIKMELVKEIKELPNPATWRLHSRQNLPIEQTLIPIGKRLLLKAVS
jgi:hypothetical protein